MANYHMRSARNPNVPLDGEKLLFVGDLVNHVIKTRWPEHANRLRSINGSDSYRDSIYNAFHGEIVTAVDMMAARIGESVQADFQKYLQNNNEVSAQSFAKYCEKYEPFTVDGEYNNRGLIKYMVGVSLAAGHYLAQGVDDAPEIAANHIACFLPSEAFENSEFFDALAKASDEIMANYGES